ncbi:MAG: hypothetical protein LBT98_04550 [Puniceicoccales bacterium]|nr:hypothetical protein [Puniceicoccales bacterium]
MAAGTVARVLGEFHVEWPLLLAQTLNFCVVAYLLHRFAFRPLIASAEERQRRIGQGLRDAEEARERLARVEKERDLLLREAALRASGIVEEARTAAEGVAAEEKERLARELEESRRRERERLERERREVFQKTVRDVRAEVAALAEKALRGGTADGFAERAARTLKD